MESRIAWASTEGYGIWQRDLEQFPTKPSDQISQILQVLQMLLLPYYQVIHKLSSGSFKIYAELHFASSTPFSAFPQNIMRVF